MGGLHCPDAPRTALGRLEPVSCVVALRGVGAPAVFSGSQGAGYIWCTSTSTVTTQYCSMDEVPTSSRSGHSQCRSAQSWTAHKGRARGNARPGGDSSRLCSRSARATLPSHGGTYRVPRTCGRHVAARGNGSRCNGHQFRPRWPIPAAAAPRRPTAPVRRPQLSQRVPGAGFFLKNVVVRLA